MYIYIYIYSCLSDREVALSGPNLHRPPTGGSEKGDPKKSLSLSLYICIESKLRLYVYKVFLDFVCIYRLYIYIYIERDV